MIPSPNDSVDFSTWIEGVGIVGWRKMILLSIILLFLPSKQKTASGEGCGFLEELWDGSD
jgi:hypothetical protein